MPISSAIHTTIHGQQDAGSTSISARQGSVRRSPEYNSHNYLGGEQNQNMNSQDSESYDNLGSLNKQKSMKLEKAATFARLSSALSQGRPAATDNLSPTDSLKYTQYKRLSQHYIGVPAMGDDPHQDETPIQRLQRLVRSRVLYSDRLDCKNLGERLQFEHAVLKGAGRFTIQIFVFIVFIASLRMISNEAVRRGIFKSLDFVYGFEDIESISTRKAFILDALPDISQKSKQFSVLSSEYFTDANGVGSSILLKELKSFRTPGIGPTFHLQVAEFSFTAWIQLDSKFVSGYLFRKRPIMYGEHSGLSCWGWYFHNVLGPQLHYGAHDFMPSDLSLEDVSKKMKQLEIGPERHTPLSVNTMAMFTVAVSTTNATFYRNTVKLGTATLPVPLTDCFNGDEGILIGDSGMEIGMLKFHPGVLTERTIGELYSLGDTLADIASGSGPTDLSDQDNHGQDIDASVREVHQLVQTHDETMDINQILAVSGSTTVTPSPDGPLGAIPVGPVTTDTTTGRDYYPLLHGPYKLSQTTEDADHRYLTGMPSFLGTGVTFTWWHRHINCEGGARTCGIYLWRARDDVRPMCWTFWVENDAIWFDNDVGSPPEWYPHHFVADKYKPAGNQQWRHMALQLNEETDELHYYIDGKLAWKGAYGSPVEEADCVQNKILNLGRLGPKWTYGAEVEMYDFRMWVHGNAGPLVESQITAVSQALTPELDDFYKCLPITAEAFADSAWTDNFQHGCEWYYKMRQTNHPTVCNYAPARINCPIACSSRQECLTTASQPKAYFTWSHIRRIESRHVNGTICVGDNDTSLSMFDRCMEWKAAGGSVEDPEVEAWLDNYQTGGSSGRKGRRVEVTDCEELQKAIDDHCSLNLTAVQEFTRDMRANGGDYTIGWWMKPLGMSSLIPELGRYIPHIQFYSTLSPPQHQMSWGIWANPNGEHRGYSSCGRAERDIYENIEMKAASDSDWTFLAITRRNASRDWVVETNLGRNWEASVMPQCLYDPEMFFNAIEVNYPSLISPIMMVPVAMPFAQVQELYLQTSLIMGVKSGPNLPMKERVESNNIPIEKKDFLPQSVLLAPPIVFMTRRGASTEGCKYTYSDDFLHLKFESVKTTKCVAPFQCDSSVTESPEMTLSCPGEPVTEPKIMDILPLNFDGKRGYPEFLSTVTHHQFLNRADRIVASSDFFDSLTEIAQVMLVFYTPTTGITSILLVTADFQGHAEAELDVQLHHHQILEGSSLTWTLVLQVSVALGIVVMLIDMARHLFHLFRHCQQTRTFPPTEEIILSSIDVLAAVTLAIYLGYRIPMAIRTAEEAEDIMGGLSSIEWNDQNQDMEALKLAFFDKATELMKLVGFERDLDLYCTVILFVCILRIIEVTQMHPRLALLTGTVRKAADDLWHSGLLVLLLSGCFAAIATWSFGSEREDFKAFDTSMQTQFMMMFGEFPDNWQETDYLVGYIVAYFIVVFLLVQNFLLAIIVESYMFVRKDNELMVIEQEFVADILSSWNATLQGYYYGWPSQVVLGKILSTWHAKYSVGFRELYATGHFRDQGAVSTFIKYYRRYEFLKPVLIDGYPPSKEGDELIDKLERRIGTLLGREPLSLKQLAEVCMKEKQKREVEKSSRPASNAASRAGSMHAETSPLLAAQHSNGGSMTSLVKGTLKGKFVTLGSVATDDSDSILRQLKDTLEEVNGKLHLLPQNLSARADGKEVQARSSGTGSASPVSMACEPRNNGAEEGIISPDHIKTNVQLNEKTKALLSSATTADEDVPRSRGLGSALGPSGSQSPNPPSRHDSLSAPTNGVTIRVGEPIRGPSDLQDMAARSHAGDSANIGQEASHGVLADQFELGEQSVSFSANTSNSSVNPRADGARSRIAVDTVISSVLDP